MIANQDFMVYVDMNFIEGWTIQEDAPQWAKDDFYKYIEEMQKAQENGINL